MSAFDILEGRSSEDAPVADELDGESSEDSLVLDDERDNRRTDRDGFLLTRKGTHSFADFERTKKDVRQALFIGLSICGFQFVRSVKQIYLTPFLRDVGASQVSLALVWVIPHTLAMLAPIIGVLSDRSTLFYGRRRPFFIVASILQAIGLIILSFCSTASQQSMLVILAVMGAVVLLDAAYVLCLVPLRAMVADVLPRSMWLIGNLSFAFWMAFGDLLASSTMSARLLDLLPVMDSDLRRSSVVGLAITVLVLALVSLATREPRPLSYLQYSVSAPKEAYLQVEESFSSSLRPVLLAHMFAAVAWAALFVYGTGARGVPVFFADGAKPLAMYSSAADASAHREEMAFSLLGCVAIMSTLVLPLMSSAFGFLRVWSAGVGVLAGIVSSVAILTAPVAVTIAMGAGGIPYIITRTMPFVATLCLTQKDNVAASIGVLVFAEGVAGTFISFTAGVCTTSGAARAVLFIAAVLACGACWIIAQVRLVRATTTTASAASTEQRAGSDAHVVVQYGGDRLDEFSDSEFDADGVYWSDRE